MLEAIGAGAVAKAKQDWAQVWLQSNEHKKVFEEIQTICSKRTDVTTGLTDDREYAMPLVTQIIALTKRTFTSYWRDPDYLLGKYVPVLFKLTRLILHVRSEEHTSEL